MVIQVGVVHHAEVVMLLYRRDTETIGLAGVQHAEAVDQVEVHHAEADDVLVPARHPRRGCCWVVDDRQ